MAAAQSTLDRILTRNEGSVGSPGEKAGGAGAAAGIAEPGYEPWSRAALLRRMQTFKAITWFAKPAALSAAQCALRGWRNTGPDLLACDFCSSQLCCRLPSAPQLDSMKAAVAKYVQLLVEAHEETCPWRQRACDASLLAQPADAPAQMQSVYSHSLQQLQQLDALPAIGGAALAQLAAAAMAAGVLEQLAQVLCIEQHALEVAAAATSAAPGSPGAVADANAPAALSSGQRARLLALCGWQPQALLAASATAAATAFHAQQRPSVFGVSHLLGGVGSGSIGRAGQPATGLAQLPASHTALCCAECGNNVGLWGYCRSGPLYQRALQSKAYQVAQSVAAAAAASTAPASAASAPAAASSGTAASAAADARGSPAPSSDVPHPPAPLARTSSLEVARTLHQTIAGGVLTSDAPPDGPFGKSAAAPFGSDAPAGSVFGLNSFEVEAQRQLSRSLSGSPAAGLAATALGGSFFISSMTASGGDEDGRPAKQRRVGGGEAEEGERLLFDPLALHRPWCPWAHAPQAPTAAAAASGDVGSGWLYCLQALATGGVQVGGGSVSAAAGADYGAKVRQALGALRGTGS